MVKLFLHISKDEQKKRPEARLEESDKRSTFADLEEYKLWDDYALAYEEAHRTRANMPRGTWSPPIRKGTAIWSWPAS